MLKGVYGPPRRLAAGRRLAPLPAPHTAKPHSTSRSRAHDELTHTTHNAAAAEAPASRRTKSGQTQPPPCLMQVHQTASATTTSSPSPTRLHNSAGTQRGGPSHTNTAARVCSATVPCVNHTAAMHPQVTQSVTTSSSSAHAMHVQHGAAAQRPPMPSRTRATTRNVSSSSQCKPSHSTTTTKTHGEGVSVARSGRPNNNVTAPTKRVSLTSQTRPTPRRSVTGSDAAPHKTSHTGTGRRGTGHIEEKADKVVSDSDLALAKHDMDFVYHCNPSHWVTRLTPLVATLLQGNDLESPYTTYLWTQAYDDPQAAAAGSYVAPANASDGVVTSASDVRKKNAAMHLYTEQLKVGYYACVRCGNPICAPRWQCQAESTRAGYAVFARMHRDGLVIGIVAGRSVPRQRMSGPPRLSSASLAIVARCACCQGCMGHMDHLDDDEKDAEADRNELVHSAQTAEEGGEGRAVLVVNSACLTYVRYRTAANLAATYDVADGDAAQESKESCVLDDTRHSDDGKDTDMSFDELGASFDSYRSISSSSSSSSVSSTQESPKAG